MKNSTFYQRIFKSFPTPTLVVLPDSPKHTIIDVNKAFLNLSNTSEKMLLGNSFSSAIEQALGLVQQNWEKIFKKVLEDKISEKLIIGYKSKHDRFIDTGDVYHEIEVEFTCFSQGDDVDNIIVSFKSLTKPTKVPTPHQLIQWQSTGGQKNLNEAERVANIASWEVNMDTSAVYWSEMVKKIHEVDNSYQPTLESALNFYEDESRKRIEYAIKQSTIQDTSFDLELQLMTARRNNLWVRVTGKFDFKDGRCVRIYGLLLDISEIKKAESDLLRSEDQLKSLVESVEGIAWEADLKTETSTFISDKLYDLTGFVPERWRDHVSFILDHVHEEDKEKANLFYHSLFKGPGNRSLEYRLIRADGSILWINDIVSVIYKKGRPRWLRGIMMDITLKKRNDELENLEKQVLELNAKRDIPLQEIIKRYFLGIEVLFPHIKCSLYQVRGDHLYNWMSPSLPQSLIDQVGAVPIAEKSMSCGTAAFRKQPVIVRDISTDPLWENYCDLILSYGLKACWSYPVLDSNGKVLASLGVYFRETKNPEEEIIKVIEKSMSLFKIILENRQSQKLLQDAATLMKQGQDLANLGNWKWNLLTNEIQWSDSIYNIYGLDDHSLKMTFEIYLNSVHPNDREMVSRKLNYALKTKEETEFEERIIRPDGETRYLKSWCKVVLDENGEVIEMNGACLDISESKDIQRRLTKSQILLRNVVRELKISNERYKFANKATNEAIYDIDLEKKSLYWGEGFYRLFGYKTAPYNLYSDLGLLLIHPDERPRVEEELKVFMNDSSLTNWNAQYRFLKADQSYSYVKEEGYAVRNKEGNVIRIIGSFRDISLRKQTEQKMSQLHQERERNLRIMEISNAELEQFAHTISHDLLEPLRMVTGFLAQIEKKYSQLLDEKGMQYVLYALDGAKRMRKIILELLNFSKVGQLDEEKEQVDLNILIEEILILYRRKIKDKQASFKIAKLPTIYTLKSPARLIFQSLVNNALAFQKKGVPPFIEISFEETESFWSFTVADNGIGIDETMLDRAFILFHRLQADQNLPGTGMGLAVSKKIVESLGGRIWIDSKIGIGSKFHFTLAKGITD